MTSSHDPLASDHRRRSPALLSGVRLTALIVFFAITGCGKKADAVPVPEKKFAWATGQYIGDRFIPIPKAPPTTTDVVFKIVDGALSGRVGQSIQNPAGGLPERISDQFEFDGPLIRSEDGNATFDISGKLATPGIGTFHVTGHVLKAGTADFVIDSSTEVSIAELIPNDQVTEKDRVPANIHSQPGNTSMPVTENLPTPTKKVTKRTFVLRSQGFAMKR